MRILFLLLSLFSLAALNNPAWAQETNDPLVKVRLLAERGEIGPGDEVWIGAEQSITPKWHTYWKNPGDSGTPTTVTWTLPEGFEVSEIHWPTPEKLPFGPLLNYGYENQVMLLQKLKTPENLPDGPITLMADIELLVCKEECIPEYGTYELTLNGPNAAAENNIAYFQAARSLLPKDTEWSASFGEREENFELHINAPFEILEDINLASAQFFPEEWGLLSNPAPVETLIQDDVIILKQARGERSLDQVDELSGIFAFETMDAKSHSFSIKASQKTLQASANDMSALPEASSIGFLQAVLFALIGGLILNLMPCVFPVLSIKALSLVKISEEKPKLARMHGIAYTAGVVLSFLAIAAALIALQTGGAQVGWGFQLQNPLVVGGLVYLLFVLGLNLIGFFEFINPFCNVGGKLTQNDGISGSFFTGVLATLVATPCTAPFMAGAIGFAFVQPPIVSLTVFAALGFGLALPYLILSFVPAARSFMPKPGPWMDVFKQALAFPMFAAALWLFWVLGQQVGTMEMTKVLGGALLIVFSIWLFRHVPTKPLTHHIVRAIAVASVFIALALLPTAQNNAPSNKSDSKIESGFGENFTPQKLTLLLEGDAPVFTEMTAAWCITCKVNHAVALNVASTKTLFAEQNISYIVGDWTNEDPEITQYLQKYGRNGVPLYVYYGPRDPVTKQRPEANILPQVLTPAIVAKEINNP
ncbi:MAG: protein-disulfide reductase DsbD domain-containing protein [Pseudomonadota bacterium]